MIRPLKIISSILFFLSCNPAEKNSRLQQITKIGTLKTQPANFDTLPNGQRLLNNLDSGMVLYYKEVVGSDTLKGGYITCYGIDDSMRYFYLRKDNTLRLLNKATKYQSPWSLGRLEKDLNSFFIINIDNGNGVPSTYQVFDKKTGKNILGNGIEAWNFKYFGNTLFFLYDNHTVDLTGNSIQRKCADSIFLYNTNSGRRQGFKLAKENPGDIIYYEIRKVTNNSLTINRTEYLTDEETLVKYSR